MSVPRSSPGIGDHPRGNRNSQLSKHRYRFHLQGLERASFWIGLGADYRDAL